MSAAGLELGISCIVVYSSAYVAKQGLYTGSSYHCLIKREKGVSVAKLRHIGLILPAQYTGLVAYSLTAALTHHR